MRDSYNEEIGKKPGIQSSWKSDLGSGTKRCKFSKIRLSLICLRSRKGSVAKVE